MSVRMKITHSKTASRRAHHQVGAVRLVSTTSGLRRRHCVDPTTGMYRGKQIIVVAAPVAVKDKKKARTPSRRAAAKTKSTAATTQKEK